MIDKTLSILFLARYAPNANGTKPKCDNLNRVYGDYHNKVYEILSQHFEKVMPSNDPEIMLHLPHEINYIFSLYNRMPFNNSEVFVSSVAEYHGVNYLGATPNIRALAEDKYLTKMLANYVGVPTPNGTVYFKNEATINPPRFSPPYFVKPRFGAASLYIDEKSICDTWLQAQNKIGEIFKAGLDVLVEEFVDGIYYTSPVLRNFSKPLFLPCVKEVSNLQGNVVTHKQKRKVQGGLERSIAQDRELNREITKYSKMLFDVIQPLDYTRFDYIIERETSIIKLLEFNVCCNLGMNSTVAMSANSVGISYEQLLLNIIYSSLNRSNLSSERLKYQF